MRVEILGCGEAFDDRLSNTSVLVRTGSMTALLDCGYSAPPRVWAAVGDASEIDVIYVTHPHADHYFGLPALLGRMWEDGRRKPLILLSQPAVLDQIGALLELGYRNLSTRFEYRLDHRIAEPGATVELCGASFDFAQTRHSVTNLAVRIRAEGKTFFYSGDGMYTKESSALFSAADLVVHEAYFFETSPVHADIGGLITMADEQRVKRLALVHVHRLVRREPAPILAAMARSHYTRVSLPEPGAVFDI
jgi:ribonuclease Z